MLPLIGPFPKSLESFVPLMRNWLNSCLPVVRVAFGAILLQPVKTQQEGYQLIAEYLPSVKLSPGESSDFSYQINRPRDSKTGIPNLRINRLTKWSVAQYFERRVPMAPGAIRHFDSEVRLDCRLELDINTAPDFQEDLPSGELSRIFEELVALGEEIATKGDLP